MKFSYIQKKIIDQLILIEKILEVKKKIVHFQNIKKS
jgi:hypothetical protein